MTRNDYVSLAIRGRRAFLRSLASLSAVPAASFGAVTENRAEEAYRLRSTLAAYRLARPEPTHPANTNELDFPNGLANYSKGLPHDDSGEPTSGSYQKLVGALTERRTDSIETVPLAGSLRLVNPAVSTIFVLEGSDAQQFSLPVPPSFGSLEQASEMAELSGWRWSATYPSRIGSTTQPYSLPSPIYPALISAA